MMITSDNLDHQDALRHGFFTRRGGVSVDVLTSLNCGFGAGDRPENVRENRHRAMAKINCRAENLNTVYQIHSPHAVVAEKPWAFDNRPKADAIVTAEKNLAIGILTADCTPVLFADVENRVIGAAHAGWRGALGGVLENCVRVMEKTGAVRQQVRAVIGPCIHQKSYEVGPEFRVTFIDVNPANSRFFIPSDRQQHYRFDLPGFVRARLEDLNIGQIDDVAIDTYTDEERFFSYRRATHADEGDYGRGLSAIVMCE
jgi:YfiH family protein